MSNNTKETGVGEQLEYAGDLYTYVPNLGIPTELYAQMDYMEKVYVCSQQQRYLSYQEEIPLYQAKIEASKEKKVNSSIKSMEEWLLPEAIWELQGIVETFAIYTALKQHGFSLSFLGLTHTLDYRGVIAEMYALVNEGKYQEAMDLYNKPRRYWR